MNKKLKNISPFLKKGKGIRKLVTVFVLLLISTSIFSQVTVSVKQQTIKQALRTIERATDYRFFYSNQLPDLDKTVSFEVDNQSIDTTLDRLFSETSLIYEKKENNQIYLAIRKIVETDIQKNITGTVFDTYGEPIIGANVLEKGTRNGAITNIDGEFSLPVSDNAVLQVTYIGYITQEINVAGKQKVEITLTEDTQALDEVVVIAYGTTKRKNFTGSVSSVKIENSPVALASNTNALESLRGNVSGLDIAYSADSQSNSKPGAGTTPSMQVRGQSSISGNNEPLVVVDGIIFMGDINTINPSDIATIDVLKDATSAAAYGSRSANGVVMITTKKGKTGKPVINFSTRGTMQTWHRRPELMNGAQWLDAVAAANKFRL